MKIFFSFQGSSSGRSGVHLRGRLGQQSNSDFPSGRSVPSSVRMLGVGRRGVQGAGGSSSNEQRQYSGLRSREPSNPSLLTRYVHLAIHSCKNREKHHFSNFLQRAKNVIYIQNVSKNHLKRFIMYCNPWSAKLDSEERGRIGMPRNNKLTHEYLIKSQSTCSNQRFQI